MLKKEKILEELKDRETPTRYNYKCVAIIVDNREEWNDLCKFMVEEFNQSDLTMNYIDYEDGKNRCGFNLAQLKVGYNHGYCDEKWYRWEGYHCVDYKDLLADEIIEF